MDLRDTPDEAAFREQLRAWLRDNLPAEQRRRVEPQALRRRLRGADLAGGVRRPRRAVQPPGDRARGVRAPRGAAAHERDRARHGRADDHGARHRGAEAPLPPEDAHGRGDLVPGLLRARRRLRPRGGAHAHRGQGRPLPRQRPEGLVVGRAPRELLHPRRPRRSGRAEATSGPHVRDRGHERAGRRGSSAAPDHRRAGVQRDLLHRRAGAEGEPARRDRRRLAGRDDDAAARARHARLRARRRARAAGDEARRAREGARAPTIRSSATASRRSGSSCRR